MRVLEGHLTMERGGRILLADDDECVLRATSRLLCKAGYDCECAEDADVVVQMLREQEYDVLVADIKMPGNPDLELIQLVPDIAKGLPVILVTGYPSLDSAMQSVMLHVTAYLVKPVDFDTLLEHVRIAVRKHRLLKDVRTADDRLKQTCDEMAHLRTLLEENQSDAFYDAVASFRAHTYRNIASSLMDAWSLDKGAGDFDGDTARALLDRPTLSTLGDALRKTIDVLNKTKSAFKSKDLGELRRELEELVKRIEKG